MNYYSIINIVISLIGVFVPLLVAYLTERKTRYTSCFFAFVTLGEEDFFIKTKRKSNIMLCIVLTFCLIALMNSCFHFVTISEQTDVILYIVSVIVWTVVVVLWALSNSMLIYLKIKFMDEKLQKCNSKSDITGINSWINVVILMEVVVGLVIGGIIAFVGGDRNVCVIIFYGTFLLSIGLEGVLNSFIAMYVKIRRWYHVDNICIKVKTTGREYNNIFNYKKNKYDYDFVYEKDGLKRLLVPVGEVEYIKYHIDSKMSYLGLYV